MRLTADFVIVLLSPVLIVLWLIGKVIELFKK